MIVKTKTDDFGNNTIGLNNPFKGLFNGVFSKDRIYYLMLI